MTLQKCACGFFPCLHRIGTLFTLFHTFFMSYVVASSVKKFVNDHGMMSAGDLVDGLNKLVEELLKKAAGRAKENGRKTVRSCDL